MIVSSDVTDLDEIVTAYEQAAKASDDVDLAAFLPLPTSPLYHVALSELIRVEMEFAWAAGQRRLADYYVSRFPELRSCEQLVREIEFEEQRLTEQSDRRHSADGLVDSAAAYLGQCRSTAVGKESIKDQVDDPATQLFVELDRHDPDRARFLADALTRFPVSGEVVAGFQLLDELGRGAFSRVFLARERAVDGRRVVVKLTTDARFEVQALAKLRHSNIMPIYSVRTADPYCAICMPFCGTLTIAEVIRSFNSEAKKPNSGSWLVEQIGDMADQTYLPPLLVSLSTLSYSSAVLLLAHRLAEGLAHAHDRGICHRDLKPANILLGDDGEPLLLDFNLSVELSPGNSGVAAMIGGTLPYMAPEQLRTFRAGGAEPDFRADVYSLGLVVYELLSGRLPTPIPRDAVEMTISRLITDRSKMPPDIGEKCPMVTPAFGAIISKCIHPEPNCRYANARELLEDLTAQLENRPLIHSREPSWRERLAKWRRRHPRLSSGGAIAAFSLIALVALATITWRIHSDRAEVQHRETARLFLDDFRRAQILLARPNPEQLDLGLSIAQRAWNRGSESDQQFVKQRGSLALSAMLAEKQRAQFYPEKQEQFQAAAQEWARKAQSALPEESTSRLALIESLKDSDPTIANDTGRHAGPIGSTAVGHSLLMAGRLRQALREFRMTTKLEPDSVVDWYCRGQTEQGLGGFEAARASFSTCVALDPQQPEYYHSRALCHLALKDNAEALADIDRAIEMSPGSKAAKLDRGIIRFAMGELPGAQEDVTAAIEAGYPETRLWFLRARIRTMANDRVGAAADRERGFAAMPVTEADWLARSTARLQVAKDSIEALRDAEACTARFPKSHRAWAQKAHIYVDYLQRPKDAIASLNEVIRLNEQAADAYAGRAVIQARLGEFAAARADAQQALIIVEEDKKLGLPNRPEVVYQVAGAFALTAKDRPLDKERAIDLLGRAIHHEFGADLVNIDPELESLRDHPEVKRLLSEEKDRKKLVPQGG